MRSQNIYENQIASAPQKNKFSLFKIDKKWSFLAIGFIALLIIASSLVYLLKFRDNTNKKLSQDKKIECLTDLTFSYSLQLFPNNLFNEDEKLYFSDKNTLYLFKLKNGCIAKLAEFPYDIFWIRKINNEALEIRTDSGNQGKISQNEIEINKKGSGLFENYNYWVFNLKNNSIKEVFSDEVNQIYGSKLEQGKKLAFGNEHQTRLKGFDPNQYELIIDDKKENTVIITKEQISKACGEKTTQCLDFIKANSSYLMSPSGKYLSALNTKLGLIIQLDNPNLYLLNESYFDKQSWSNHLFWTNENKLISGDFNNYVWMFEFKDEKVSAQNIKHEAGSSQQFDNYNNLNIDRNYYLLENNSDNILQLLDFNTGKLTTILEIQKNMNDAFSKIDSKGWGNYDNIFVQDTKVANKPNYIETNYRIYNINSKQSFEIAKYSYQSPKCFESYCLSLPQFLLD